MSKSGCLALATLLALSGCKSEDNGDGTAGVGAAGFAGVSGISGAGAGGVSGAGVGAGAGAGGMAGAAGQAGGGGDMLMAGCESANTTAAPSELHAAALTELATMPGPTGSSCTFNSCHQGSSARAMLSLLGVTDLRMALVDKPSCLVPSIPLVDDSGGDAGLDHSWLWIKIVAPADASGVIMGDASWGTAMNCGQMGGQPYGLRMPWSNTAMALDDTALTAIRNWICAGAPGP